jgi:hypothetical protein
MSQIKKFERQRTSARFDISDFGAVGDGKTNDTEALNKAIIAASEAGGGTVFLPKGTYRCMAVRPKSGVTLQGLGWGESILTGFDDHSNNAIIDGTGHYSYKNPLTEFNMYNLELDGHAMNRQGYHYNRKGIGNQWQKNCVFRNIFVHDTPATAIGTDFTINVYFEDCLTKDSGTPGQVGNGIGSNGFGIGVSDVTEVVVFSGCQALGIANNGFTLEAQITQGIGYASITDCYTERCGNAGYSNSGSRGVNISSSTDNASKYGVYISSNAHQPGDQTIISGCQFINQTSHGVYSDLGFNNHLKVRGCLFEGCGGTGINSVGSYVGVSDNTFKGCREATVLLHPAAGAVGKGYLVNGNVILNGGGVGVEMNASEQVIAGLLLKGNLIQDCRAAAIRMVCKPGTANGNITGAAIEGNVCNGNAEPQIMVLGTSNSLIIRDNVGYNPQGYADIVPTQSPFCYTAGNSPEDLYITGGVAPKLSLGQEVFSDTPHMVHLEPNQHLTLEYVAPPKMKRYAW